MFTYVLLIYYVQCRVISYDYVWPLLYLYTLYPLNKLQAQYFFIYVISPKFSEGLMQLSLRQVEVKPQHALLDVLHFKQVYVYMYVFEMYICIVRHEVCICVCVYFHRLIRAMRSWDRWYNDYCTIRRESDRGVEVSHEGNNIKIIVEFLFLYVKDYIQSLSCAKNTSKWY